MKSDSELIFDFIEEQHELFANWLADNHDIDPTDWEHVVNQARKATTKVDSLQMDQ